MHQNSKFMYPVVPVIIWRRMPQELTQPVHSFGCDCFNLGQSIWYTLLLLSGDSLYYLFENGCGSTAAVTQKECRVVRTHFSDSDVSTASRIHISKKVKNKKNVLCTFAEKKKLHLRKKERHSQMPLVWHHWSSTRSSKLEALKQTLALWETKTPIRHTCWGHDSLLNYGSSWYESNHGAICPHVSNICDRNSQTGLDELLPSAYPEPRLPMPGNVHFEWTNLHQVVEMRSTISHWQTVSSILRT